jgi:N-acetylglucosaminyldiphosphoundecaprenol N-acetyl-beta-D-mannosaminyltransferase
METIKTERFRLLGIPVAATNMASAIQTVSSWIQGGERGKMVTFTTVHMLVEATRNSDFSNMLQRSDLNCPDGMPLVWYGGRKSGSSVERVCGPEFLPAFSEVTAPLKFRHFFYGGGEGVAAKAVEELQRVIPDLQVAGFYSPPFRPLTAEEDQQIVDSINASNCDLVWVCLGCPKQEIWITTHRYRLNVPVLLAVGLALDVAAGTKSRAPLLMRNAGLEWLFRLCQEPRRLWKRYLIYNSIFLYRLLADSLHSSSERL